MLPVLGALPPAAVADVEAPPSPPEVDVGAPSVKVTLQATNPAVAMAR